MTTETTLREALPTARELLRQEWSVRTWYGRLTLPGEAIVVTVLRALDRVHAALPNVYRKKPD